MLNSDPKILKFKFFAKSLNLRPLIRTLQSFNYFSFSQQRLLLILAFFMLSLFYLRFHALFSVPPAQESFQEIVVEVSGEVCYPGIHVFNEVPTLEEVIKKAGGLKEVASLDGSRSSRSFKTGTLISVVKENPGEIQVRLGRMEARKLLVFSIPLDLNQATVEDLCLIPGIGESLAQEITAYRQRRRAFRSLDELKDVKGIGEKKYQSLRPFLTVEHLKGEGDGETLSPSPIS
jgi:competence ComEA-like helix-hairpin-helix protein